MQSEQDEYLREALPWQPLEVADNQDTLDMMQNKPNGLIAILEEKVGRLIFNGFPTGIELNDVIELEWVNGRERYFYAKNYGLVGWERKHDDPHTPPWSAISEIHQPGSREPFTRERLTISW